MTVNLTFVFLLSTFVVQHEINSKDILWLRVGIGS